MQSEGRAESALFSKYPAVKRADDADSQMTVSEFLRTVRRFVVSMDVKESARTAKRYIADIFSDEDISDVRLEMLVLMVVYTESSVPSGQRTPNDDRTMDGRRRRTGRSARAGIHEARGSSNGGARDPRSVGSTSRS